MHGPPYRVWTGSADSMFDMACNYEMVSFFHFNRLPAFEFQRGMAAQDDHPLVFRLIVPKPGRAAMGLGDDALDSDSLILEKA